MTTPQITVTFDPALPTDSGEVFDEKNFAFVGSMNPWSSEANSMAEWMNTAKDEINAALLTGELGDLAGKANNFVIVNSAEDGVSFGPTAKPENLLINGDPKFAQRGTSFTITAGSSAYTADRWLVTNDTNQTVTVTQEALALGQTDMPKGARNKLRLAFSTAPTSGDVKIEQRIEDVQTLWGRKMTLVAYCDGPAGSETLAANAVQHFGTGGSPSSDVTTAMTVDRATIVGGSWRFSATVDVPSVSGKVLGTDGNDYLAAQVVMTPRQSGNYEIGYVSVNEGDTTALDNPMKHISRSDELSLCETYYQTSNPGGVKAISFAYVALNGAVSSAGYPSFQFRTPMRGAPTMSFIFSGGTGSIFSISKAGFHQNANHSVVSTFGWDAEAEL